MEFQESLGREVFEYEEDGIVARVIKHNLPFGKSYLYIPHGPEIDFNSMSGGSKNPINKFINWLRDTAKNERAIYIKIEPIHDLVAQTFADRKFRKSKKEIQPSKTIIIDLNRDDDQFLESFHHKTRYNIRVSEKTQTKLVEGSADEFWKLLKKTTDRQNFSTHSKEYYQQLLSFFGRNKEIMVKCFLIKENERVLAGAIVLMFDDTAYYIHGASDYEFQSLRPAYRLQWLIIKWLRNKGYSFYDLWGVDSKKWPGVTKFKMVWGGKLVERPGSFDLPISKLWYILYKSAKLVAKRK